MASKLRFIGLLCLASVVASVPVSESDKRQENKVNIVKDYACLRDGELCHPDFKKNRGMYVTCSNGVAWEQQCPKCSYHPISCPTRSLWFDGEKCDWASPKLATAPCMDRFPMRDIYSDNNEQESEPQIQQAPAPAAPEKEKSKSTQSSDLSNLNKPKFELNSDVSQELDDKQEEEEKVPEKFVGPAYGIIERKSIVDAEATDFPSYLSPDDSAIGTKIVRLSEPVYALVNTPDGKQVLMKVSQPFVLEDSARMLLPNMNFVNPFELKDD